MPRIEQAPIQLKPVLRNLLTQYLIELAALQGVVAQRSDDGHVPYHWFDYYWLGPERLPFAIWVGDELAGFCLLRDTGNCWEIAEFFVVSSHRRKGVGTAAVTAIKEFCRESGRHDYVEANTLHCNLGALAFWRGQGFATVSENAEQLINVFYLKP